MGRFLNKNQEKLQDVQDFSKHMGAMVEKYGSDLVGRIYATAIADRRRASFEKKHGIKESPRSCSMQPSLLNNKRPSYGGNYPVYLDHGILWNKDGKPNMITFEPYDLSKGALRTLIEDCDKQKVDFYVTGNSFYFPDSTVLFVLKKEGTWNDK